MRPRGAPPPSVLAHRIDERDGLLTLRLADAADVSRVLADCAAAGCVVEDLEVGRADLEDVFLQLMAERPRLAAERVGT
jgi:ABC-2 type transport system ATP-binding protein